MSTIHQVITARAVWSLWSFLGKNGSCPGSLAALISSKFHWRGLCRSPIVLRLGSIVSVVCYFVKPEGWSPIRWDLVKAARWPSCPLSLQYYNFNHATKELKMSWMEGCIECTSHYITRLHVIYMYRYCTMYIDSLTVVERKLTPFCINLANGPSKLALLSLA